MLPVGLHLALHNTVFVSASFLSLFFPPHLVQYHNFQTEWAGKSQAPLATAVWGWRGAGKGDRRPFSRTVILACCSGSSHIAHCSHCEWVRGCVCMCPYKHSAGSEEASKREKTREICGCLADETRKRTTKIQCNQMSRCRSFMDAARL